MSIIGHIPYYPSSLSIPHPSASLIPQSSVFLVWLGPFPPTTKVECKDSMIRIMCTVSQYIIICNIFCSMYCILLGTVPHMVKCHEDAYWPNNLSLFSLDIEGYWDQKNKVMKENRPPVLSSLSLEHLKIFY